MVCSHRSRQNAPITSRRRCLERAATSERVHEAGCLLQALRALHDSLTIRPPPPMSLSSRSLGFPLNPFHGTLKFSLHRSNSTHTVLGFHGSLSTLAPLLGTCHSVAHPSPLSYKCVEVSTRFSPQSLHLHYCQNMLLQAFICIERSLAFPGASTFFQ